MLRTLRHWITARATDLAAAAAPHLPPTTIDRTCARLGRAAAALPVVARNVARNMQAVGVYTPAVFREHFENLGAHFAGALHALRWAPSARNAPTTCGFPALAAQRVAVSGAFEKLRSREGAIIVSPHVTTYLLFLARINQALPLTVYLRYSADARRRALKERWYRASGVAWVSEPPDARGPLGRLGQMATLLRQGRTLYITPDLPQKKAAGTPVQFFGREIYLPSGAAYLAVRTRAPLYFLAARAAGPALYLDLHGPLETDAPPRGRLARELAVRARMQWFASHFERFIRQQPALWYLWADKRWTRLLAGDARYTQPVTASRAAPLAAEVS